MYGQRIFVPDTNDVQRCLDDYVRDALARIEHDRQHPEEPRQSHPAENVRRVDGKSLVDGQYSVMGFNGAIARLIFERNPEHECYCEESLALDWMYPRLTPHQFIFKVHREPLAEISPETIQRDREFWMRRTDAWLGVSLHTNTSLREVVDFAERTY